MPADHITDQAIDAFASRTLSPDALVQFADHVATCDECRQRAALRRNLAAGRRALEDDLGVTDHVTEDDVHAYVDGRLDAADRDRVAAHFRDCPMCAAEVTDLEQFAASRVRRTIWTRPAYMRFSAAAALIVSIVIWKFWPAADVRSVVALRDQGAAVTLKDDGTLEAGAPLSTADAEVVRHALSSGTLAVSPVVRDLGGASGTLMGTSEPVAFALMAPVATGVLDDRPTFRWAPLSDASSYTVIVKPQAGGETVSSPPLEATAWTPEQPLQRGRLYSWQVVATVNGRDVLSPAPPAPAARFEVADAATADRLRALPASHAVRGILYANAGLVDAAGQELSALASENPESTLVRGLLSQVRTAQHREAQPAR